MGGLLLPICGGSFQERQALWERAHAVDYRDFMAEDLSDNEAEIIDDPSLRDPLLPEPLPASGQGASSTVDSFRDDSQFRSAGFAQGASSQEVDNVSPQSASGQGLEEEDEKEEDLGVPAEGAYGFSQREVQEAIQDRLRPLYREMDIQRRRAHIAQQEIDAIRKVRAALRQSLSRLITRTEEIEREEEREGLSLQDKLLQNQREFEKWEQRRQAAQEAGKGCKGKGLGKGEDEGKGLSAAAPATAQEAPPQGPPEGLQAPIPGDLGVPAEGAYGFSQREVQEALQERLQQIQREMDIQRRRAESAQQEIEAQREVREALQKKIQQNRREIESAQRELQAQREVQAQREEDEGKGLAHGEDVGLL